MEFIIRIIGYCLIFIVDVLMYYFLHSHFTFIVLVLMVVAPLFSAIGTFMLRNKISVEVFNMDKTRTYGTQGEEAYILIKVNNPSFLVGLDVKLDVQVKNTFFKTEGRREFVVPIRAFKGYELELPIIPELPGVIEVKVNGIKIKDTMGFFALKKNTDSYCELVVMPIKLNQDIDNLPGLEQGMLESEESTKKGNDFSDVQEIREYIPGDKLMSIHWKLSAKRDILMVKDRVSMSDKQLVILPELTNQNGVLLNQIVANTYAIISQLIKDKTTVRLLYWSVKRYEYEDIRIDHIEDLKEAFAKMFYEETYMGYDEGAINMASVHPEMKAYVHVYTDGSKVHTVVREI